jgi:hypothetical protein
MTYHNAGESKIGFKLNLANIKERLVDFFNSVIIDELRKSITWLADDLTIQFGRIELESFETRLQNASNMYSQGVITFNEYREIAELPTVENGDVYNWQVGSLQDQNSQAQLFNKVNKEKFYNIPTKEQKPRTRICNNCKHFDIEKRWCKLNSFPVEATDGCNRFEHNDEN